MEAKEVQQLSELLRNLPDSFQWKRWIWAWETAQNAEIPARAERFALILASIRESFGDEPIRILDLGVGCGSLAEVLIKGLPKCEIVGIDLNPFLLELAARRLPRGRVQLTCTDIVDLDYWRTTEISEYHVVVSAAALHWLTASKLNNLFELLSGKLVRTGVVILSEPIRFSKDGASCEAQSVHQSTSASAGPWDRFWDLASRKLSYDFVRFFTEVFHDVPEDCDEGIPFGVLSECLRKNHFHEACIIWQSGNEAVLSSTKKASGRGFANERHRDSRNPECSNPIE